MRTKKIKRDLLECGFLRVSTKFQDAKMHRIRCNVQKYKISKAKYFLSFLTSKTNLRLISSFIKIRNLLIVFPSMPYAFVSSKK